MLELKGCEQSQIGYAQHDRAMQRIFVTAKKQNTHSRHSLVGRTLRPEERPALLDRIPVAAGRVSVSSSRGGSGGGGGGKSFSLSSVPSAADVPSASEAAPPAVATVPSAADGAAEEGTGGRRSERWPFTVLSLF